MQKRFDGDRLRYFIGDVRDSKRLLRAAQGADVIIHARLPGADHALASRVDGLGRPRRAGAGSWCGSREAGRQAVRRAAHARRAARSARRL